MASSLRKGYLPYIQQKDVDSFAKDFLALQSYKARMRPCYDELQKSKKMFLAPTFLTLCASLPPKKD
jgi:hypothetical protein